MKIGQLVKSKVKTGVCEPNEVGVCVEEYSIGLHKGWQVIFENGGYDGFSKYDCETMLDTLPLLDEATFRNYTFTSVLSLRQHYENGYFSKAFETAKNYINEK